MGFAIGEIVFFAVRIEIVGFKVNDHGNGGLRDAIGKDYNVLVGFGDGDGFVKGGLRGRRETGEGGDDGDVGIIKDANFWGYFGGYGGDEESEGRGIGWRFGGGGIGGGDGYRGDGNRDMASFCEPEFLEFDHFSRVIRDFDGFDVSSRGREVEEE